MNKKLPKVFANRIEKSINNNKNVDYVKDERKKLDDLTILEKINQIFSSSRYVYKAEVIITLEKGKVTKKIIGRNKNELITMDNETIKISDLLDIEFKE